MEVAEWIQLIPAVFNLKVYKLFKKKSVIIWKLVGSLIKIVINRIWSLLNE